MNTTRTNQRSPFLRRAVIAMSLLAVVAGATTTRSADPAVAGFRSSASPPVVAPDNGSLPDSGLGVLFGKTAVEAEWAVVRYSPNPGLELMFSRLYPVRASA